VVVSNNQQIALHVHRSYTYRLLGPHQNVVEQEEVVGLECLALLAIEVADLHGSFFDKVATCLDDLLLQ
jgi:hypothetical protein